MSSMPFDDAPMTEGDAMMLRINQSFYENTAGSPRCRTLPVRRVLQEVKLTRLERLQIWGVRVVLAICTPPPRTEIRDVEPHYAPPPDRCPKCRQVARWFHSGAQVMCGGCGEVVTRREIL